MPAIRQDDRVDKIERARALAAAGEHRSAFRLLREVVDHEEAPYRSRLALAELYREQRLPDQAGRWGIVFDGWTTANEQDRLTRLLAASGVDDASAAAFLQIPRDRDGAADFPIVLAGVPGYRARFHARPIWTPPVAFRRGWPARLASASAKWLLYSAGGAAVVTMVGVFQQAVTQEGDTRGFAIGGSLWFVGFVAAASAAFCVSRIAQGLYWSGFISLGATAALSALLVAALPSLTE